jgi:hypothetical protein
MPQLKSKATKADPAKGWADLLQAELSRRETLFPADALDLAQVCQLLRKANLPCGDGFALKWLARQRKAGRVKMLKGIAIKNGKPNHTVRYVIV